MAAKEERSDVSHRLNTLPAVHVGTTAVLPVCVVQTNAGMASVLASRADPTRTNPNQSEPPRIKPTQARTAS